MTSRPVALWRYLLVLALLLGCVPALRVAASEQVSEGAYGKVGLSDLPRRYNDWSVIRTEKLDQVSLDELIPDDYVSRTYALPNRIWIDTLVVYGHTKKTFHSPGFCLPGGGFVIESKEVVREGLPVPMNLFRMRKDDVHLLVLYTFVQDNKASTTVFGHNWNLLKARLQHKRATGALIRFITPVWPDEEVTLERVNTFIRAIYPDIQARINSEPVPANTTK